MENTTQCAHSSRVLCNGCGNQKCTACGNGCTCGVVPKQENEPAVDSIK